VADAKRGEWGEWVEEEREDNVHRLLTNNQYKKQKMKRFQGESHSKGGFGGSSSVVL